ncbi:hypothetical protein CDD83_5442 [Cordyceps sp. RAO-2017]|nr:hypothetical protein CDD83_5442 [Cordyceps sp. RAO-2017]
MQYLGIEADGRRIPGLGDARLALASLWEMTRPYQLPVLASTSNAADSLRRINLSLSPSPSAERRPCREAIGTVARAASWARASSPGRWRMRLYLHWQHPPPQPTLAASSAQIGRPRPSSASSSPSRDHGRPKRHQTGATEPPPSHHASPAKPPTPSSSADKAAKAKRPFRFSEVPHRFGGPHPGRCSRCRGPRPFADPARRCAASKIQTWSLKDVCMRHAYNSRYDVCTSVHTYSRHSHARTCEQRTSLARLLLAAHPLPCPDHGSMPAGAPRPLDDLGRTPELGQASGALPHRTLAAHLTLASPSSLQSVFESPPPKNPISSPRDPRVLILSFHAAFLQQPRAWLRVSRPAGRKRHGVSAKTPVPHGQIRSRATQIMASRGAGESPSKRGSLRNQTMHVCAAGRQDRPEVRFAHGHHQESRVELWQAPRQRDSLCARVVQQEA